MDKGFIIVNDEERFQVPAENFGIGSSSTGYTLQWSVDSVNWDDLDTVDEDTNWPVVNSAPGFWYRLKDNDGKVKIVY